MHYYLSKLCKVYLMVSALYKKSFDVGTIVGCERLWDMVAWFLGKKWFYEVDIDWAYQPLYHCQDAWSSKVKYKTLPFSFWANIYQNGDSASQEKFILLGNICNFFQYKVCFLLLKVFSSFVCWHRVFFRIKFSNYTPYPAPWESIK